MKKIVLASTSIYRRKLMEQLGLPFEVDAPRYEEEMGLGIEPALLVKHLAAEKALSLKDRHPGALIIGSDQVFIDHRGQVRGKPGDFHAARKQLRGMAGKDHVFYTGLAVLDSDSGEIVRDCSEFRVSLRELSDDQIDAYLRKERPYDCAGSFKIEGLGVALMRETSGSDGSSLVGLPLIALVRALEHFGVCVLTATSHFISTKNHPRNQRAHPAGPDLFLRDLRDL